jgi:hypothetical protein
MALLMGPEQLPGMVDTPINHIRQLPVVMAHVHLPLLLDLLGIPLVYSFSIK